MRNSADFKGIVPFLGHIGVEVVAGALVVLHLLHSRGAAVQIHVIVTGAAVPGIPGGPPTGASPLGVLRRVIGALDGVDPDRS